MKDFTKIPTTPGETMTDEQLIEEIRKVVGIELSQEPKPNKEPPTIGSSILRAAYPYWKKLKESNQADSPLYPHYAPTGEDYYFIMKGSQMSENKVVLAINTSIELVHFIAKNEEKLVTVLEYIVKMSEDLYYTKKEMTELTQLVVELFGVTLTQKDIFALKVAVMAGNLTMIMELLT